MFLSNSGIISVFNDLSRWDRVRDVIIGDHHLLRNPKIVAKMEDNPDVSEIYHHIIVALAGKGSIIDHNGHILTDEAYKTIVLNEMAKENKVDREKFQVIQSQLDLFESLINREESFIDFSQIHINEDSEECSTYSSSKDTIEPIQYTYKKISYEVIEGSFMDIVNECNSFYNRTTKKFNLISDPQFVEKIQFFKDMTTKNYYCYAVAFRIYSSTSPTLYTLMGVYVIRFDLNEDLVDQLQMIQNRGMNIRLLSQYGNDFTTRLADHVGITGDELASVVTKNQYLSLDEEDLECVNAISNW
eukprot:CAMPEP_0117419288 /NCGR_PEP_ID=MMETSP0758-20121206/885_1 /TAXON_ID=63605 /ORGANISM="Percolomonas cosmopolitus, Strain AE-1 (ATCC 50343)" /LENGTH=300 /DNA_ID=CAMNT_0005200273 /DNA_START=903 /DNA_END=1802 /DNA_ORIENTATION=+